MHNQQLNTSGNLINIRRIIWLRSITLIAEVFTVWLIVSYFNIELPFTAITLVLAAIALTTLASAFSLKNNRPVSNHELFIQLSFDVLFLTTLLYFTGGSTNPFTPLFLLPLILTAATLSARHVWTMVALTITCYTLLLFFYVPFPNAHAMHNHGFQLHVVGMWIGFIFSALLIAGFTARMAMTVQAQNEKISSLREKQLKHEHVLALGTLAAGAAHELGTPLSTMAIVLNDLDSDTPVNESKLGMLRNQVDRCKTILGSISAASGEIRAESGSVTKLDSYLPDLISRWKKERTGINVESNFSGTEPAPNIVVDQTLEQALLNILNNAADASPDDIQIKGQWNDNELQLIVSDRGNGLAPELEKKAGEGILSTKQDGMGLGLFLTYTTLERLGGEVRLYNREDGGVSCQIILPLTTIEVSA